MSDLFDKFVFDLQRFATVTGSVSSAGMSLPGYSLSGITFPLKLTTGTENDITLTGSIAGTSKITQISSIAFDGSTNSLFNLSSVTNITSFNFLQLGSAGLSLGKSNTAFTVDFTGAGTASMAVGYSSDKFSINSMTINQGSFSASGDFSSDQFKISNFNDDTQGFSIEGLSGNNAFSYTYNADGSILKINAAESDPADGVKIEYAADVGKVYTRGGYSQKINVFNSELTVLNYGGNAYLEKNSDGSGVGKFYFGGKSDALYLTNDAVGLKGASLAYNGGTFNSGFDFEQVSGTSAVLEYLGGTSFIAKGLATGDYGYTSSDKTFQFTGAGGSIAFNADDGDITEAKLLSGGILRIDGDDDLKINGGAVKLTNVASFSYIYNGSQSTIDLGTAWKGKDVNVVTAEGVSSIKLSGASNIGDTGIAFGNYTIGGNDTDGNIWFTLNSSGSIAGISGLDTGAWVQATTLAGLSINGAGVSIVDGGTNLKLYGNTSGGLSMITGLSAGATVKQAGSATKVYADGIGIGTFTFGTSAFSISGTGTENYQNVFSLSGIQVTGISGLEAGEYIIGKFETAGGISINGVGGLSIVNGGTSIHVYGNADANGVGKIANLMGGASVYGTASAATIETAANANGLFSFYNGTTLNQSFSVANDNGGLSFIMNTTTGAVSGITGFNATGDSVAVLTGSISDIYINDPNKTMSLSGVVYNQLKYMINADGVATLAGVSAADSTTAALITNAAGASVIGISGAGEYNFFGGASNYTVGMSAGDTNGLFFVINGSNSVAEINSFEKGDTVSGDFANEVIFNSGSATVSVTDSDNNISVIYDDIIIKDLNNAKFNTLRGVTEAWTASGINGESSFIVTDEDNHSFTVTGIDANGVQFLVNEETGHIYGVSSLGEGVTLTGSLSVLDKINGVDFDIKGDSSFGVIGGTAGISTVFNLGSKSGVTINSAGGASYAMTDMAGTFTFGDSSVFTIVGDTAVTFNLDTDTAKATGLSYLGASGTGFVQADSTIFAGGFSVNGQTVEIVNDANDLIIYGTANEDGIGSISNVGPSSTIASATVQVINAGGASQIITDQVGGFSFADSGQFFTLAGDSEITFGLSGNIVNSIDKLEEAGSITGEGLSSIKINGVQFDISGDVGNMTVFGEDSYNGITKITGVGGGSGATVSVINAASAAIIETDMVGGFSFATDPQFFDIVGDSSVQFQMDPNKEAAVIGISAFGDEGAATVTGDLLGVDINNSGLSINVVNDSDNKFSYMVDANGAATLGGVSGSDVSITAIAGASTVQITGGGSYTFGVFELGTYGLSGDNDNSVFFTKNSIVDLDKDATVTGSFSTAGFSVNSKGIQVTGDNNIGLIGGESAQSVEKIFNLSPSSTVVQADGVSYAYSDTADANGQYTFQNGTLSIAGDSNGVTFLLDGKAGVIGISGLDAKATLTGSLDQLKKINGREFDITGDSDFGIIGAESSIGAIFGLGGTSVYINNAGGASKIITNKEGTFYFKQGESSATATVGITLGTDSTAYPNNAAVFTLDPDEKSYAVGVSGLKYEDNYVQADHTVFEDPDGTGERVGFKVNGKSVVINGDEDDLYIYALSGGAGIEFIAGVGSASGVTIANMGGASVIITDKIDSKLTFDEGGQTFKTGGESYIAFATNGLSVTAIGGIDANGWVESDSTVLTGIEINGVNINIQNDDAEMRVYGKGTSSASDWDFEEDGENYWDYGITKITKVGNESGSAVIVTDAGGATTIETDKNGSFYFASGQSFILNSTSGAVTEFIMDASHSASVTGIEAFEDGTIQFNTVVTALSVNTLNVPGQNMTFTGNSNDIVLTIDPYTVVGAGTINGGISGMVDGTVIAEGPVTVNGMYIDITEETEGETYGVIVKDSEAIGANSVTGDATVNVASFSVAADGNGDFDIGGVNYEFTDSDNAFNFTTGSESQLTGVTNLDGYMVDEDGDISVSINGDDITVDNYDNTPVTLRGDGSNLTAVEGITDGSTVTGDLDKATVAIPGNTIEDAGLDEAVDVTINGNRYALYDDDDGILVIGAKGNGIGRILDLNDEASVQVAKAGTYSVNSDPAVLTAQAGDIIIGDDNRTTAYIYDPNNILVRPKTPLHEIERITGLTDDRTLGQVGGPSGMGTSDKDHYGTDTPLTKADTDFIFGISSASTAHVPTKPDLDLPLAIYIDNTVTGTQVVDFTGKDYPKVVHMYNGSQSVIFNPVEGGNLAHVESVGSGQKDITLGNGGDVVVVDQKAAIGNKTNIVGGAGADSVFVRASGDVVFDMSKGGADKVVTFADANARVTLEGYQASLGGGVKIDELQDSVIADAIENDNITFGDGVVSINSTRGNGNHSEVDVGQTVGGSFVNLFNHKNEKQAVGFTSSEGGVLDGSSASDPLILIGNKDGKKSGGSTMSGGSGPDTIFGGADDSINARGGNNTITMHDDSSRGGATIAITEGQVTINNMNNSLVESTGDTLEVGVKGVNSFKYNGSDFVIDGDGFYAVVANADQNSLGNYTTQYIKNTDNNTVYKVAIGADNATMYVTEDEDVRPNAFYGENGAVSFEKYTGTAAVDLKGDLMDPSLIDDAPAFFDGVNKLIGGEGEMVFKGSDANETLVAGSGMTSLYGDGGKNVLSGYPYESSPVGQKEGYTTFFVLGNADGAANTITNFEFVSDDNYKDTSKVTADRIEVQTDNNFVRYVNLSGNDLYFEVADKAQPEVSESVVIKGAYDSVTGYGKDVRIENGVSQVGRDKVLVDRFADFYMATEKNATVYVDSSLDSVNIWLEDPDTGKNFEGDFAVIDATGSDAKAELSGNGKDNTIIAGTGDTSLWGGGNGDDYLVGGIGKDSFFYNLGNGNDTFVAGEGDEVILGDMTISDIISADASDSDKVVFTLRDGARLTVNEYGTSVDFKVANNDGGQDTYYLNSNRELTKR